MMLLSGIFVGMAFMWALMKLHEENKALDEIIESVKQDDKTDEE